MAAITVAVSLILLISMVKCCPPAENLAPLCSCRVFSGDSMMTCSKIMSPDQLIGPIKAISMSRVRMFSLAIEDSSLTYIPDGIFPDTHLEKIFFIKSEVMSLSESDVAFAGLENTLTELRATEANYIAQWDWQQIRNLKKLKLVDINYISLGSIDEPFPHLPEFNALGIAKAEISFIVDSAFANLPNLQILNLKENSISELKRNMFPNPADKLAFLDLSDNEISHLPEDFFTHMPSLSDVHLDRNKFVTLNENPFSTGLNTIYDLTMNGNPFRCDCRMRWIVGAPVRSRFTAQCASPKALAGREIRNLDLKSLLCF